MNTSLKGPIDSIFLVFLALMGSVGFKLLGCPLQHLLQNNVWARQFTYCIVVLFTSSFLDDGTNPPVVFANTESWNGTAWTEVNDLNIARGNLAAIGSSASALAAGGSPSGSATEEWSGPAVQTVTITVS